MISREELLDLATDFGLAANIVEKDYALGWVLAALGQHSETRDKWLFKGGTCLKKCFLETYRFSEDLDFTLLDADHLDEAFLAALFDELAAWVYDRTGLELPADLCDVRLPQRIAPDVTATISFDPEWANLCLSVPSLQQNVSTIFVRRHAQPS